MSRFLFLSRSRLSILTPKKSQSRPSRKSRRFSKVSLDTKDVLDLDLDWSRRRDPQAYFFLKHLHLKSILSFWGKSYFDQSFPLFEFVCTFCKSNLIMKLFNSELIGFESLVKANNQVIGKIGKILQYKISSRCLHLKEHIKP